MTGLKSAEAGQLGYGFTPPASRRPYSEGHGNKIDYLLEAWLDMTPLDEMSNSVNGGSGRALPDVVDHLYKNILNLLKGLDGIDRIPKEDGEKAVIQNQRHPRIKNAGLFLSAFYDAIGLNEIVFDLETETPLDYLGYKLPEGRTLILKTDTGEHIGCSSEGTLVNYGTMEGNLGPWSTGNAINFGEVKYDIVVSGNVINYGKVRKVFSESGKSGLCANFGYVRQICNKSAFNLEEADIIDSGVSVNFGKTLHLGTSYGLIAVNLGEAQIVGCPASTISRYQYCFPIKHPKETVDTDKDYIFEAGPEMKKYLEDVRKELEKYRNSGYPDCLGVLDFLGRASEGLIEKVRVDVGDKWNGFDKKTYRSGNRN